MLLCVVVERAKKCLDFAVTLFFFHLLACAFYEVSGNSKENWNIFNLLLYFLKYAEVLILSFRKEGDEGKEGKTTK